MKRVLLAGYEEKLCNYQNALFKTGLSCTVSLDPNDSKYYDALLLPGGGDLHPCNYKQDMNGSKEIDTALDTLQLQLLDRFVKDGKPVMGICRGIQLINVYFGGDLVQDLSEDLKAIHTWETEDKIHGIDAVNGSFVEALYGSSFLANSAHHQVLDKLGEGLEVCAYSKGDHLIEAVSHTSLPVIGVQWHPERLAYENRRPNVSDGALMFRYFSNLIHKNEKLA
ncbi:MAG: gamma-glutamyl-gamma-aminobutyrate hydrolase family protein [Lachnospiraceae bacterium]|nr:gamma-glutamyl-gamma-aminobutyrate hydrolase family protein [Lachnospiraceae bacterium]